MKKISTSPSEEVVVPKKPIRKFSSTPEKETKSSSTISDSEEEKPLRAELKKVSIKKSQVRKPKKISTSSESEPIKIKTTSVKTRSKRK